MSKLPKMPAFGGKIGEPISPEQWAKLYHYMKQMRMNAAQRRQFIEWVKSIVNGVKK